MGIRADSAVDNRTGSLLYETNVWMWRFGRARVVPRTISEAKRLRARAQKVRNNKAAATRVSRKADSQRRLRVGWGGGRGGRGKCYIRA